MCNAVLYASELVQLIKKNFTPPEEAKDYDGYVLVNDISGSVQEAKISGIIRSFNEEEIQKFIIQMTELVNKFKEEKKLESFSN